MPDPAPSPLAAPGPAPASELLAFVFTDLVDSAGWKQALGDARYADLLLRPHNQLVRQLVAESGGTERNFTGDGFLVTFPVPSQAVLFALKLHAALDGYGWDAIVTGGGRRPETRIGIHLGEAIAFADTAVGPKQIAGQAVDLAARVMSLAAGRQTLLTRHAFDSARQHVRDEGLSWLAHGPYRCKGADDPLDVCEVGAPNRSPLAAPPDSEKARRVRMDAEDDTGSWRPAVGLPIPRRDGWRVEQQLGAGGFGEVWLARHRRTKEQRVFKFCFDGERLRSFKRELTFFKLLRSELGDRPDIAKLHEVNVEAPPYFLEGEFVPAGNLAQWAAAQGGLDRVPLGTRLRLIEQVARAVAAAHSLGIIHKDLKPSNVLIKVDTDGTPHPVLNDFGIGVLADRAVLQGAGVTETGFTESVMFKNESSRTGTRLYSPPEASLGKPATTGADVYALGVMLFQMVVGDLSRPLGTGWQDAVTVETVGDGVQAELLREDITAATHGEPSKRLPAAADLADRLARLDQRRADLLAEREREDLARQVVARLQRIKREQRLKRLRVLLAGSVVVAVATGALGLYAWQAKRHADTKTRVAEVALGERDQALGDMQKALSREGHRVRERDDALNVASERMKERDAALKLEAERAKERDAALDDARYQFGISNFLLARAAYEHLSFPLVLEQLDKIPVGQRGWEWHYLKRMCPGRIFTLYGHTGHVTSVAFSPDGRRIATASEDRKARVWDARTGAPLTVLNGHTDTVRSVAFSPDGTRVATGGDDATARVWDVRTGSPLAVLEGHKTVVRSVAFSPDGARLATAGNDATARVWDARTGDPLVVLNGHAFQVTGVAFSPDGARLATASVDGTARIWDAGTGFPLLELKENKHCVWGVAYSPDGSRLATASQGKAVRIWDARTGAPLLELRGHTDEVYGVAFSPDGTRLATAGKDKTARVWDAWGGAPLEELKDHKGGVTGVAFSPDGARLSTASEDKTVRVWDTGTDAPVFELTEHKAPVFAVGFSPDGNHLFSASLNSTRVSDAWAGAPLADWTEYVGEVLRESFGPEGGRLAVTSMNRWAQVWDAWAGAPLTIIGLGNVCVAYNSDRTRLATAGGSEMAQVWEVRTGDNLLKLKGHTGKITSVVFSPDGARLATAGLDMTARVWDARTGTLLLTLRGHTGGVYGVAFSPDGARLSTASEDKTVRVWDAQTGASLAELKGHTGVVTGLAYSPDGARLATASWDNTARVWDTRTGVPLLELKGHASEVNCVAFSPDGTRLATADCNGTVRVWGGKPAREPAQGPVSTWDVQEIEHRLHRTQPDVRRYRKLNEAATQLNDAWAARFYRDRLLSTPAERTAERFRERTADPRLTARSAFHHRELTNEPYDHGVVRGMAGAGDQLARRLVAQEYLRAGQPKLAVPLLFHTMLARPLNGPPVEELLLAQAYLDLNQPAESKRFYKAAADWLDGPRHPMRAANVVTHAVNPWNAVGECYKPIDDPRYNPFDWESWHECDVFRAQVEQRLAAR